MLLPALALLFGTVFWALTLWPEPHHLQGVTWPNLFFADQPFPLWQIAHSAFEIGAMLLLTSGLLLILRRRQWSMAQISATGVVLALLSLASFSLWTSAAPSALFLVFLVGLGLASSPWLDGPLGGPPATGFVQSTSAIGPLPQPQLGIFVRHDYPPHPAAHPGLAPAASLAALHRAALPPRQSPP